LGQKQSVVRILAVSDQVVESLYSARICERFGDVGLVLSCGDVPYSYLEYIVTMLNVPCFFVHGNHDRDEYLSNGRTLTRPEGWVNLNGKVVMARGMLLAGLEGSFRYKPRAPYQYTEAELSSKIWRMTPALLMNRVRYGRYLDILITHAPPFGIHDGSDRAHRGFRALLGFMARFRPRYLLHGHKHVYRREEQQTCYLDTEVVNVYPFRMIEW
jgi:Icc-related predicted phosphoesterase